MASSQPSCQPSLHETSAAPLTLVQGIVISGQVEARGSDWYQSKWNERPTAVQRGPAGGSGRKHC